MSLALSIAGGIILGFVCLFLLRCILVAIPGPSDCTTRAKSWDKSAA